MSQRSRSTISAAILAAALLVPPGFAAAAAEPSPPKGSPEQKKTISDIRRVGSAMFAWYKEQVKVWPKRSKEPGEKEDDSRAPIGGVPVITRGELARILVPKYIAEVPENDGWGHPYEYRLETQDLEAHHIMVVRSAGSDGRFSGDTYPVESFPAAREDEDIAWMDGYFVRWPEAGKTK
ncbi:MAG TPA: hypothetical protein VIH93_08435 [Thermoanaerobaculia bacterium]|jgi:hypothetical protein